MSIILSLFAQLLHIGLLIVVAPSVAGVLDWLDAQLSRSGLGWGWGEWHLNAGRRSGGPPVLQPWRDLVRLSRKTPVTVESISIVSQLAPAAGLGATLAAAALVPSFTLGMALAPLADVLVVVSLLTVARVAAGLAALDAGTALPGLAAQRASAAAVLAEPALMLAVVTLALMGGSFNLDLIISQQREGLLLPAAASAVALAAILALVLTEATAATTGRLDSMLSGTGLAMSLMAGWLRRLVWIDLIGGLFLPVGVATTDSGLLAWLGGLGCWVVKLVVFVLALSAVQTLLGRIPNRRLTDLIGVAALLALLAVIMVLASTGTA